MTQRYAAWTTLLWLLLTGSVFAQVNSSIGGIVQDPSQALVPGVTITVTNTLTGVTNTTVSNDAGAYNFAALVPGIYKVQAELPGFRTQTFSDVQLSAGTPVRLNFTLEVGTVAQSVEVTAPDALLSSSSSSIGEVLNQDRVEGLPLVSNDVLDLVRILPGYRESPGGNAFDSFAGQASNTVNTVRDGLSVTDGRFNNGVFATTTINPDLVGEIRLVLTPVDAELGRGNAQVQIFTRSGTNRFTGSAVWNVRNTALDPNTWLNNQTIDPVTGATATRNWYNNHEYTVSYGGPIQKNKTFFFALWEQNIHRERSLVDGNVLTDTARMGIFRYYDGWNPQRFGVSNTSTPTTSPSRVFVAVDPLGNPVPPTENANGSPYSGLGLQCFSVFGTQRLDANGSMVPFTSTDCPGGSIVVPPGGSAFWDSNRQVIDSTGYIFNALLKNMPHANYFGAVTSTSAPDGLNTATIRWIRPRGGNDDGNTTLGLGDNWARKQFNIKVDHNFNQQHKFAASYTLERNRVDTSQSSWPNGYGGDIVRKPHIITSSVTSTLSPTLVNEARFGMRYNKTDSRGPWENDNAGSISDITGYFTGGADPGYTRAVGEVYPVLVGASGNGNALFGAQTIYNFNSGAGGLFTLAASHNGNRNILLTYGDTLSWTKGKHAFRFGGEYRPSSSKGYSNIGPNLPTPRVYTGAGGSISPLATASIGNSLSLARSNAAALLYLLSGSINNVEQGYWIDSYKDVEDGKWQSVLTSTEPYRDVIIHEMSGFAKDDWKITKNLTLNLGLRWEYYGSPYVKGGYGATPDGLGTGLFGIGRSTTGGDFDSWLLSAAPVYLSGYGNSSSLAEADALQCTSGVAQTNLPTSNCNSSFLTTIDFFGPGSPNPDVRAIPADYKNIGPAIGFAYQVPWFGGNRTIVRGGYQISYTDSRARSTSTLPGGTQAAIGTNPGSTFNVTGTTQLTNRFPSTYLDLSSIATIVPGQPIGTPSSGSLPLYTRASTTTYGWSPDYKTPYIQNFNLSVTTNIRRNMTLDVRYIGTQARKLQGDLNVNTNNIYYNQELFDALTVARYGGDSPLLTQMLAGLNLGSGVIGSSPTATGANALRRSSVFNQNLIDGNFIAVANSLLTGSSVTWSGFVSKTINGQTPAGRLIRNGCDRIAATGQTTFNGIQLRCFPENFLISNPQLGSAVYRMNSGTSNYHSLQVQYTLRPTQGLSLQTTYTWAKTMEIAPDGNTDLLNRRQDYRRSYSNIPHDLRTNGTFELPIGPGKLFFANSGGALARILERWQVGAILNLSSGRPVTILGGTGLNYGSSTSSTDPNVGVDVVGDFDVRNANFYWDSANNRGSLFGSDNSYTTVTDPQCPVTGTGQTVYPTTLSCNLRAVARDGKIVLQNPNPGTQGTLGQMTFEMPGTFRFDANLSKNITLSETKSLQIRMDATNVLNHPNPLPGAPAVSINDASGDFGYLTNAKTGTRAFQAQVRISF